MSAKYLGKSFGDYVDQAVTPVKRDQFSQEIQRNLKNFSPSQAVVEALYEITDEYLRTDSAIRSIRQENTEADWKLSQDMIAETEKALTELGNRLKMHGSAMGRPTTALLATHLLRDVEQFQRKLARRFRDLRLDQRINESMIRMVPLKTLKTEYVAELDQYVTHTFPQFTQQDRDRIIAATMSAARQFTLKEKMAGVTGRIPMARSRARRLITSHRKKGTELVVRKNVESRRSDQKSPGLS